MPELSFVAALLVGFFGSSHCLLMCGGIGSLLGTAGEPVTLARLLSYNSGRLLTYTLIGALAGMFGELMTGLAPALAVPLRVVAGALLIAMGLYVSRWWLGLTRLEAVGEKLWRYIQPLSKSLLPIRSHPQALALGMVWGLLPCGLVYSTLSWALAAADWQQSALFMLAFGLGTLPALLSIGMINRQLIQYLQAKQFRWLAGILIIAMGVITMWVPLSHQQHGSHDPHQHEMQDEAFKQPENKQPLLHHH